MTPAATKTATARTLSTAEERREAVLEAAMEVFAERGYLGTPTMPIAKAAGISQAYLFRLFPTKADLVVAVVQRSNARIYETFEKAGAAARAKGEDPLEAMGLAYVELVADRALLLTQLHAHAASASMPEVGEAVRDSFARLYDLVLDATDGDAEAVKQFMAYGMLINVMSAAGAGDLKSSWAEGLTGRPPFCGDDPTA